MQNTLTIVVKLDIIYVHKKIVTYEEGKMSKDSLIDFQKKFNLEDSFIESAASLFDKLVSFGYISNAQKNRLIEKLYENVEQVILGAVDKFEYKTGLYNAHEKTLYIRNPNNLFSVYFRLLNAITRTEIGDKAYSVGFATTIYDEDIQRISHENFAINRAVCANLSYKLLDVLPDSIAIEPSETTRSHDFLGYAITSYNDIYAMEGKILSEMCFALDISEELIYQAMFADESNNIKNLEKIFQKVKFDKAPEFLTVFDKLSRQHSNYQKFTFMSKLLNLNYIELRNNVLDPEFDLIKEEREDILNKLKAISSKFTDVSNLAGNADLTAFMEKTLKDLEKEMLEDISNMQNMLADAIMYTTESMHTYRQVSKLKQFNDMLICPNDKIYETIFNIVVYEIMECDKDTEINIIQKLRYSLINHILLHEKLTDISKRVAFCANINDISEDESVGYAIITINNVFSQIIKVTDLDENIEDIGNNCTVIKARDLMRIINNDLAAEYVAQIEKVTAVLKNMYTELREVPLENMHTFSLGDKRYLIVDNDGEITLFSAVYNMGNYDCYKLKLSDDLLLFYPNSKKDANALQSSE